MASCDIDLSLEALIMEKEKRPDHHVQMTEGKQQIIQQLLQEYDIKSAQDI